MKIQEVINNLINGNLKEAKIGARSYSVVRLQLSYEALVVGASKIEAMSAGLYLKDKATFTNYCHNVHRKRGTPDAPQGPAPKEAST